MVVVTNLNRRLKSPADNAFQEGKPVAKFEAGLTMKIAVRLDSIQAIINRHKK